MTETTTTEKVARVDPATVCRTFDSIADQFATEIYHTVLNGVAAYGAVQIDDHNKGQLTKVLTDVVFGSNLVKVIVATIHATGITEPEAVMASMAMAGFDIRELRSLCIAEIWSRLEEPGIQRLQ